MIRKITFLILILFLAFAVSCKKNEAESTVAVDFDMEFDQIDTLSSLEMGNVLRVNSGLYTMAEDTGSDTDQIKWASAMNLGDSIMTGETRKATYDGTVYDVIKVRDTYGKEGYALSMQIAVGGRLAVVTDEKANIYRTPNTVDVTGFILSRKTVMVYYPETEVNGYVEIRAYDPENRVYRHGSFVRLASLSEKRSDIQSSILLQTALTLRDSVTNEKNRKEALLESALLEYPDSVFYSEIYELMNPEQVYDYEAPSFTDDD